MFSNSSLGLMFLLLKTRFFLLFRSKEGIQMIFYNMNSPQAQTALHLLKGKKKGFLEASSSLGKKYVQKCFLGVFYVTHTLA